MADETTANAKLVTATPKIKQQRDDLLTVCKGILSYANRQVDEGKVLFGQTEIPIATELIVAVKTAITKVNQAK